jgi:hypothetical protein
LNPKADPKLRLQFKKRDTFGKFCEALATDGVPFSLGPSLTIAVYEKLLDRLPPASHILLKEIKDKELVAISYDTASGKRRIPTAKEAEEACWRATKAL